MKKAICMGGVKEDLPLVEQFKIYKEAGFEGVEISIKETGAPLGLESSKNEILELKKIAQKAGVEIHSLMGGLLWKYPLSSADKETLEKGMKVVEKGLEAAALLGATAVLVVPGVVTEEVSYEEAYMRSKETLKELSSTAEERKIYIAVEEVWNKFLLSPLEMRQFIDEIDSEYVMSYFDVGNVVINGFPEQWIKILGKRIKKIHFKDYKQGYGFTYLLQGDVNWSKVMKALAGIGYDDFLTAELPPYKYYPEQMLFDTSKAMDVIMRHAY